MLYEKFNDLLKNLSNLITMREEYENHINTLLQTDNKNETEKFNDIIKEYEKVVRTYEENKILINLILKSDVKISKEKIKLCSKLIRKFGASEADERRFSGLRDIQWDYFKLLLSANSSNKYYKSEWLRILRSTGISLKDYKKHRKSELKKILSEDYNIRCEKYLNVAEKRYRDNKSRIKSSCNSILGTIKIYSKSNRVKYGLQWCEWKNIKRIALKANFTEICSVWENGGYVYPRLTTFIDRILKEAYEFDCIIFKKLMKTNN